MQYTQLGKSGLTVSRICLGCMSYGSSKWRPWVLDEPEAKPFFRKALDLGINFFDTADMYSMGVSEEITGRALKEMANMDEIVLATKVYFPMTDRPNMGGLSRSTSFRDAKPVSSDLALKRSICIRSIDSRETRRSRRLLLRSIISCIRGKFATSARAPVIRGRWQMR